MEIEHKVLIIFLILNTLLLLSFSQQFKWTRNIYDESGNPLFSGGYYYRSLINFVDIDADGDDDIFFLAGYETDKFYLHYYRNEGTPDSANYRLVTDKYSPYNYNYGYYSSQFPPMTTFADIDADNDYDLFMAFGRTLRLYRNLGDSLNAVFDWMNYDVVISIIPPSNDNYTNYPALVDIDDDGDPDLFYNAFISRIEGTKLQFYRNIGSPTNYNFNLEIDDLLPQNKPFGNMKFTDINDDGDYDLFFNSSSIPHQNSIFYFENIGDSAIFDFQLTNEHYFDFDVWEAPALKLIETRDIDNDQDQDFFVGFIDGPVYEYLNIGTSDSARWNLDTKNFLDIDVRFISYPQFVDIDHDYDLDLITIGSYAPLWPGVTDVVPLWLFENMGDLFSPILKYRTSYLDSISGVTQFCFADIDADGDYDLFTGNTDYENRIRFYRNVGTPDSASFFLEDSGIVAVNGSGANAPAPLLADMDNDGDLDMLVSERETVNPTEPAFNFFRNIGDSVNPVWNYESDDYFNLPYGVYDLWDYDNDRDLDLIAGSNAYTGGQTLLFENTGTPDSAYYIFNSVLDSLYLDPLIYSVSTITLVDIDADGDKDAFLGTTLGGIFFFRNDGVVGIKKLGETITSDFKLSQNYPNPFNPVTTIKYQLPKTSKVTLEIFNILGQKVITLVNKNQMPDYYTIQWKGINNSGNKIGSGVYIYRLIAKSLDGSENFVSAKKMMIIK